jgi:hypothetical protein
MDSKEAKLAQSLGLFNEKKFNNLDQVGQDEMILLEHTFNLYQHETDNKQMRIEVRLIRKKWR